MNLAPHFPMPHIRLPVGKSWLYATETLTNSQWWMVFLPGSGPQFFDLDQKETRALKQFLPQDTNLLVLNKPGIHPSGKVNEDIYERAFTRNQRLKDYNLALQLRIPRRAKILLIGFSEGAYLAPELALGDSRVKALSLLSGGTRSWLDEEIYKARHPRALKQALRQVAQVYARPSAIKPHWFGLSNRTWASYDNDRTQQALEKLKVPVFSAFGDRDRMIDVHSALEDLRARQAPTQVRVFRNADHTLDHHWHRALRMTSEFFAQVMRHHQRPKYLTSVSNRTLNWL